VARNFPCFLEAFSTYARDGFVPDRFYDWVGRSIVGAALERKVTLQQGRIFHTPNIYVMLVAHPAVGKSTAIEAGTDVIEAMRNEYNQNFKIIPNQATEPALIDLMKIQERFPLPTNPNVIHVQSAGYFYASEASASALQNTCGDFVAAMTAFYDCPKWFRKKLKGEAHPTEIENSCMNLLAGATFDYLKTLVNEQSVMGGFASRCIYVVEMERVVRETVWGASKQFDSVLGRKLVEDLAEINKLIGPMKPTPEFIKRYEQWRPTFDQAMVDCKSPRLESINSRKPTNLLKLAMILSVSEGNSLVVTEKHFDRALDLINDCYKDTPEIIAAAAMADKNSQNGVNQVIAQTLKKNGGRLPLSMLQKLTLSSGNSVDQLTKTIAFMMTSGWLRTEGTDVILGLEPNEHL
jgi:hypothetical protein